MGGIGILSLLLGLGAAWYSCGRGGGGTSPPSAGTLDTTFNAASKATTAIGGSDDFAKAVAIQQDGKIVVAGSSDNDSNYDFALARYLP